MNGILARARMLNDPNELAGLRALAIRALRVKALQDFREAVVKRLGPGFWFQ